MDEMKLLRDRAGAQPEPPAEVVAAALGRLLAEAREPSPPPPVTRLGRFGRTVRRAGTVRPRMTRGVMATLAVVMVAVAGVAAVAARDSGREGHVLMAYTGGGLSPAWREGDPEIAVFLCEDDSFWPNCGGRGLPEDDGDGPPEPVGGGRAATPRQVAAARQALAAMPQVQAVSFVTRQENYASFRRRFPPPEMAMITVADMPESFEVKLKRDADARTVLEAAGRLPGMSTAINRECVARSFLERLLTDRDECRSTP
ncbi:permease-like cell division protein FtsX [Nonomuraea muscovyensis]